MDHIGKMTCGEPYPQLVHYKQWADCGLDDVAGQNLERLDAQDAEILVRIFDHMHLVDKVFQHHLLGLPHRFHAPRSEEMTGFRAPASSVRQVETTGHVLCRQIAGERFRSVRGFVFTDGAPGRMRPARSLRVPAWSLSSEQFRHRSPQEWDCAQGRSGDGVSRNGMAS
jgi:hypothetical protein